MSSLMPPELSDRAAIERACIAAARQHRLYNVPVVVARDGKIAHISPDEFDRAIDAREARLLTSGAK